MGSDFAPRGTRDAELAPGDPVVWWRDGHPYRCTVLGFTAKRVRIRIEDAEGGQDGAIRTVPHQTLRQPGTYWEKAVHTISRDFEPQRSWGCFTRYLEIGEDHFATRHVDIWEQGQIHSYDRNHWVDDFGMLADALSNPTCPLPPWIKCTTVSQEEFDSVWRRARSSHEWRTQQEARKGELGAFPVWLLRPRRRPL